MEIEVHTATVARMVIEAQKATEVRMATARYTATALFVEKGATWARRSGRYNVYVHRLAG